MNLIDYPIEMLSDCIHDAQHFNLSVIHYDQKKWHESKLQGEDVFEQKTRNPTKSEFAVIAMFPQTWGSTSLGFGGIGGAAMTTAYTVVIQAMHSYSSEILVYFDGKFAYRIGNANDLFWDDLRHMYLVPVDECEKYEQ